MPATDEPNRSPKVTDGMLAAAESSFAVLLTVPSELRKIRCAEPRPPSRGAPAARSGTPSRSRSPMPATDEPKRSPILSDGPLVTEPSISTVLFTVPSEFMYSRWTAPVSFRSPHAPAARSATPSRSRSPISATDEPNMSPRPSAGALGVPAFMARDSEVPSAPRNSRWTAPAFLAPVRSPAAPTARSSTPSRFRSPMPATDEPNMSPAASDTSGPLSLIRTALLTEESTPMKSTYASPPVPADFAPTARSATPSPSRSPRLATEEPNSSPAPGAGTPPAARPMSLELFRVPSELSISRCKIPELLPGPSLDSAPAAMSGTPSPSRSPTAATEDPNSAPSERAGPPGVCLSILE